MPVTTEVRGRGTTAPSLFGADVAAPKARRAPRFGRETTPDGQPKAWIANPTGLTLADVEQGLTRLVGRAVTVETVSSDPDEATVTGTCGRESFSIRAQAGEDLPAVLRRLTEQLRSQR